MPGELTDPVVEMDHVRIGGIMTFVGGSGVLVYAGLTWERDHRLTMVVIALVAFATAAMFASAWMRRLLHTRWGPALWLGWTFGIVAMTALGVTLDGADRSPLVGMFLLPLMFAGLSYPPRMALAAAVFDVVVCALTLGFIAPSGLGYTQAVLATLVSAAWLCIWQSRRMQAHYDRLEALSRTDYLTAALNRRGFEEQVGALIHHYHRYGTPFALLLFDLDGFKAVNDAHGHAAGDELLRWTTGQLGAELRGSDQLARLGGDEFAVLLPECDAVQAGAALERFGARVRERTELSGGAASCPDDGHDAETLYRVADVRLYADKRGAYGIPAV